MYQTYIKNALEICGELNAGPNIFDLIGKKSP